VVRGGSGAKAPPLAARPKELQAGDTTSTNKRSSQTGLKRRREESLFLLGASSEVERSVWVLTASRDESCRRGRNPFGLSRVDELNLGNVELVEDLYVFALSGALVNDLAGRPSGPDLARDLSTSRLEWRQERDGRRYHIRS